MTSREFAYWLQGLFELGKPEALDAEQTRLVKQHLAMVFKHEIDPSAGSSEHQAELGALHEGDKPVTQSELKKKLEQLAKSRPPQGPILRC